MFAERATPVHDADFRREWLGMRRKCYCCGVSRAGSMCRFPPGLVAHHLIRGTRSDESPNLTSLCSRCHDLCHSARIRMDADDAERLDISGLYWPNVTFPEQLAVKRARDPDEWDGPRLEQLWHRHLPEIPAVPAWIQLAYGN